jgi:hypothetical protein
LKNEIIGLKETERIYIESKVIRVGDDEELLGND